MKRLTIIMFLLLVLASIYATLPRSFIQVLSYENGAITEAISNSPKTTAPGYTATADILSTPGEVLSTATNRPTQIRIYRVGEEKQGVLVFVQLGWFPTQWLAGDSLRIRITLDTTAEFTEWTVKLPSGMNTISNLLPTVVIPAYVYNISGQIKGVKKSKGLTLSCEQAFKTKLTEVDSNGKYGFQVRFWSSPQIIPYLQDKKFIPKELTFTNVKSDISNADFKIK